MPIPSIETLCYTEYVADDRRFSPAREVMCVTLYEKLSLLVAVLTLLTSIIFNLLQL